MSTVRTPARSVIGLAIALMLGSPALSAQNSAEDHPEAGRPAPVAAGLRLYGSLCVGCHGPTGTGVGGIDLGRGPLPRAGTDAALAAFIASGSPASGMPAFRLEPGEIGALVAFIRTGFGTTESIGATIGDAGRGRVLVEGRGNCLSCHRVDAAGAYLAPELSSIGTVRSAFALQRSLLDPTASMLPINRPVRAVTRDGRVITGRRMNEDTYTVQMMNEQGRLVSLVKADLREWTVTAVSPMPAYGAMFSASEIADVVGYLASLKGAR